MRGFWKVWIWVRESDLGMWWVAWGGVDPHRIDSNGTTVDSDACIPHSSTQVDRLSAFQDGVFE